MPHPMLAPLLRSGPWRLMVLALLLAGCGDSGIITPLDNAPMQLVLTPSDVVISNHQTVQMEMGQRLPDGRVIPLDAPVAWSSSSPAVANVDGTGLLLARLPGEVTIRASSRWGDVSGRVTILPVSADLSLEVTDHLQMVAGSSAPTELRARIVDSAGRPVPGVRVDFSVQGSSVSLSPASRSTGSDGYASTWVQVGERAREFDLLVSSPGLEVPAAGAAVAGTGGPAASSGPPGQLRKAVRLQVSPSDPASLEVIPGNAQMVRGEERTFAAVIRDQFGNTIETSDVRWRTLDNGVATVSSSGRVTALVAGATQVAAEHGRGPRRVEGASEVLVGTGDLPSPATLRIVSGSGRSTSVRGEIDGLTIEVRDKAGRPVAGVAAMWSVRSGSGTMVVPATSTDGNGRSSNTFVAGSETGPVTVRAEVEGLPPVSFDLTVGTTSLRISAPRTSLTSLGETVQLAAEARDEAGNVVHAPSLMWTSSDTNVASVNSSGRVIANAIGTAVISVAAACCSGDQISISVTQEVASVQVSPSSASMEPGSSRQFIAEARDARGNPVPGVTFNWTSTRQSVASVTSSGLVSASAEGSAGIRASVAGQLGQASLTVSGSVGGGSGGGSSPFPNEPAGYVTRFNDGFDYPGVSLNDPWFDIIGSNMNGRFDLGGRPSISRENNGQPFSPNSAFRAFYPGGMPGGHDAARLAIPLSGTTPGGFYLAYTMRLPQEWHTSANEMQNGIKHVIPWVIPSDGSEVRPLGWSGMAQNPRGDNRYRIGFTLENISPETFRRYNIPYVNEASSEFNKGDWILVELRVQFDRPGVRGSGRIELFVNGTLVALEENARVPVERLRNVTISGTYGGGIGNVPHDMWYDVGHFYVSTPGS
jgi:uncharacterized protein YjdB